MERQQLNAYSETVDGLVLPVSLARRPALDFCNTLAGWGEPNPGDYLKSYGHLAAWAAGAGLVPPETGERLRARARRRSQEAERVLHDARRFRASFYAVATSGMPWPDRQFGSVAKWAAAAASASVLQVQGDDAAWVIGESAGLSLPLLAVARDAGDLLASEAISAVHACPGKGCGWLFLDRSGRRRWCTMATCGNRDKVRRHAERTRRTAV